MLRPGSYRVHLPPSVESSAPLPKAKPLLDTASTRSTMRPIALSRLWPHDRLGTGSLTCLNSSHLIADNSPSVNPTSGRSTNVWSCQWAGNPRPGCRSMPAADSRQARAREVDPATSLLATRPSGRAGAPRTRLRQPVSGPGHGQPPTCRRGAPTRLAFAKHRRPCTTGQHESVSGRPHISAYRARPFSHQSSMGLGKSAWFSRLAAQSAPRQRASRGSVALAGGGRAGAASSSRPGLGLEVWRARRWSGGSSA